MIDNVRIKKFLFDQTFDIVNVITPNKFSFRELQKILVKSNVKRNQFFYKQVSEKNFIVTEKYLKFDDDELNFDQFTYFMNKCYVDFLNGENVDVNNHQKLTISSDIESIITSIKLSSSDLKKRLNDILIDVIIPMKINNVPSYLFNEDFYASCAICIRKNKYFQVKYGNEQVCQRKNYAIRSEAMRNILYYLEFSQELFQQQCNKKVNNPLLQIIIDEKLKSKVINPTTYQRSWVILVESGR